MYRAEHLAKKQQRLDPTSSSSNRKPILIICCNRMLATYLAGVMESKGIGQQVIAVNFLKWCRDQLTKFEQPLPRKGTRKYFEDLVTRVVDAVDSGAIPSRQYAAILVDEGHDFEPEWWKLIVKMIDTETNSLLVAYDDAQRIYNGGSAKRTATNSRPRFTFKSVGIQARGRTTILRINY
jgi:superfamily I DNA/RNA helicase